MAEDKGILKEGRITAEALEDLRKKIGTKHIGRNSCKRTSVGINITKNGICLRQIQFKELTNSIPSIF